MRSSGSSRASVPVWARAGQGLAVLLIAGYLIWTIPGVRPHAGFNVVYDGLLQGAGYAVVAVLCVVAAVRRSSSVVWRLVSVAVVLRAFGFVITLWFLSIKHPLPFPSIADVAWVLSTVALIGAVAIRLRELARRMPVLVVLDGIAIALLLVGVALAVLARPIRTLSAPGIPRSEIVVNVGYPVLDTALLVAVATLVTAVPRRLNRSDLVLVGGCIAFAFVDIVYVILLANGSWRPGTLLASLSLVATAFIAAAVSTASGAVFADKRRLGEFVIWRPPGIGLPASCAGAAFVALAVAGVSDAPLLSLVTFVGAGVVAIARGVLTLREDRREAHLVIGAASEDVRRFQALVEASNDFIGIADVAGAILYINPAGRRMIGMAPDADATRYDVSELFPRLKGDLFANRWPDMLARGGHHDESELLSIDGVRRTPVAVSTFVMHDPDSGKASAVATIQHDISGRLAAERAVRDLADQRERLLGRLVRAQEQERARIAADVHDDPVQALAAVDLRLGVLRRRLAAEAPELVDAVDVVQHSVSSATGRLRDLLFDLEPPSPRAKLADALADAAEFIYAGSTTHWRVDGDRDLDLPEPVLITAYRIGKEALVNARKHANARMVVIQVSVDGDRVVVSIRDDGRGIDPDDVRERPGHLGLASMRDRALIAGGDLDVRPRDSGGTEVRLAIPIVDVPTAGGVTSR